MPSLKKRVTATTNDALANDQDFAVVGPCVINMWAAGVTATDDVQLKIGTRALTNIMDVNIESSADVLDTDRDQLIFNEVLLEGGKLSLPCTVTTELQVLLSIKPL